MNMRVVWSGVMVCLVCCAGVLYAEGVQEILDSKVLTQHYNGVLVDYLVEEGKDVLPEAQQKEAVEQLVAALKSKTNVTKDEQFTQGLGAAYKLMDAGYGDESADFFEYGIQYTNTLAILKEGANSSYPPVRFLALTAGDRAVQ